MGIMASRPLASSSRQALLAMMVIPKSMVTNSLIMDTLSSSIITLNSSRLMSLAPRCFSNSCLVPALRLRRISFSWRISSTDTVLALARRCMGETARHR